MSELWITGRVDRRTGSLSGAAAVLQLAGCLGQELCLTIHLLVSVGHGVTHEAEQRETSWTLECFPLQQDVLWLVCAVDASL